MSEIVKKPRSTNQKLWSKEFGRRSTEFKNEKKERLSKINNESNTITTDNNNSDNNLSNSSDSRNSNKYIYTTFGIISLIILFGIGYKYKNKFINNSIIPDINSIIPDNKIIIPVNKTKVVPITKLLLMD